VLSISDKAFRRLVFALVVACVVLLSAQVPAPWSKRQVVEGRVLRSELDASGRYDGGSKGVIFVMLPDGTVVSLSVGRFAVPRPGEATAIVLQEGFYGQRIVSFGKYEVPQNSGH
jgi:hypothetical protein